MVNQDNPQSYYLSYDIEKRQKDVNGYIRKKYDSLVNKFKNAYGIDLQAIGNATLK